MIIPIANIAAMNALTASRSALTSSTAAIMLSSRRRNDHHADKVRRIAEQETKEGVVEISRQYSIEEIDQMRNAIRWSYGSGSYYEPERQAEVERTLRTYMMAGIDPEEVRKKRDAAMERDRLNREEEAKFYRRQRQDMENAAKNPVPNVPAVPEVVTMVDAMEEPDRSGIAILIVGMAIFIAIIAALISNH